jgi:enoyl-[acyl-carrier protein] reductase II
MTPADLREEILKTKALTSKPFGVDLLAVFSKDYDEFLEEYVDICIELGVKAFITGLGIPVQVVDRCHRGGMAVGAVCGKLSHVRHAVQDGCDLVIVQGTEGGGHTGQLGLMAFLPQAVDAVGGKIPVVAAGGIFDGRGVAASFALGAEGVWVGTRFVASKEAHTVKEFKTRMLETSTDDGTVISKGYTGKTCRVIANDFTREWEKLGQEPLPFPGQFVYSLDKGANHLGEGPETEGVDPNLEFMPW